jgi:hypothetical protein
MTVTIHSKDKTFNNLNASFTTDPEKKENCIKWNCSGRFKNFLQLCVVVYICNPRVWEAKTGELQV